MYLQDPLVLFPRHHPLIEGPFMGNVTVCIFCVRIGLPFYLSNWLNFGFWTLIVYVQIVVCYVFAFCSIWLVLLLRVLFRLFHAFLLWPGYQVSPYWPSHLGSGQTMTSPMNLGCNCGCNDYSSDGELQCQPKIIKSLPQWSTLGSHSCLFNMLTLSLSCADHWSGFTFTFDTLWSPEHCISSDQWVW